MAAVLDIESLGVSYPRGRGRVEAVREVSIAVAAAECVGVVGESGSGKTQTFMAAMGLLESAAHVSGSVRFEGRQILARPPRELNRVRGVRVGMIFQDPMTSLTPHLTVGTQMAEILVCHLGMSWSEARGSALDMLGRVRVADARRRLNQYPHELSGGMRQRVMIGMSLLCGPALVVADEPTSALDGTVQVQILELLRGVRREFRTAVVLISHDLGVVAGLADRIVVMYAGRVVESAPAAQLLRHPRHPYTSGLLRCAPDLSAPPLSRMQTLPGEPPNPAAVTAGCAFAARCAQATERCRDELPPLRGDGSQQVACHHPLR